MFHVVAAAEPVKIAKFQSQVEHEDLVSFSKLLC